MLVTFELPPEIENLLSLHAPEINILAREATLIRLCRLEKISLDQLANALNLSLFQAEALLLANTRHPEDLLDKGCMWCDAESCQNHHTLELPETD